MSDDARLGRLEHQIGRLLRAGVAASATLLAAGLVSALAGWHRPADWMLRAGLIVLLAIPGARVAASFVDAMRRRDRLLAFATASVLTVLAILLWMLRAR